MKFAKRKGIINDLTGAVIGICVLGIVIAVVLLIVSGLQTAVGVVSTATVTNESIAGIANATTDTLAAASVVSITSATNPPGNLTLNSSNYSLILPNTVNWTNVDVASFGTTAYVTYTYNQTYVDNDVNTSLNTMKSAIGGIPNWLNTIILVIVGAGLIGLIMVAFMWVRGRNGGDGGLG